MLNTEKSEETTVLELWAIYEKLKPALDKRMADYARKTKAYHDEKTPLIEDHFTLGEPVLLQPRRKGKITPLAEGPYTFVRYEGRSSAIIFDGVKEVKAHVS